MIIFLTLWWTLSPLHAAPSTGYHEAFNCLKALVTEVKPNEAYAVFNRNNVGVIVGTHSQTNGYFALTPKNAFFVQKAELSKAGPEGDESKVTITLPGVDGDPIKFFVKPPTTNQLADQITLSVANEFDRQVMAEKVTDEVVISALNLALGRTFKNIPTHEKSRSATLSSTIDLCTKVKTDFKLSSEKGLDSTFLKEVQKIQDRLKPGVFNKDYWLPKKGG